MSFTIKLVGTPYNSVEATKEFTMNQITDPLLLKETASRGQVALVYGAIGLFVGAMFLGNRTA